MNSFRIASALLILAATTALTACGDGDPATTAAPTPSASTSAAASVAPASPSAAPAAGAVGDKELCTSVKKAADEMKAELLKSYMNGEPSAADLKKILTDLEKQVAALVATGGDSKVAAALKPFGAEAAKAAAAADPGAAADNPAFLKAGSDASAACKAVGVNVTL